MTRRELREKTVRELKVMARKAGIAIKGGWKKEDLVNLLSAMQRPASKRTRKHNKTALGQVKATAPRAESIPKTVLPPLPVDERREDRIVTMPVTPRRIYVYWDVAAEKMEKFKGSLNLKVRDISGNCFFFTPVSGGVGEAFVNIKPEIKYAVELGVIDNKGEFVSILPPESAAAFESGVGKSKEGYYEKAPLDNPAEVIEPARDIDIGGKTTVTKDKDIRDGGRGIKRAGIGAREPGTKDTGLKDRAPETAEPETAEPGIESQGSGTEGTEPGTQRSRTKMAEIGDQESGISTEPAQKKKKAVLPEEFFEIPESVSSY